jgi:hypothetical protein
MVADILSRASPGKLVNEDAWLLFEAPQNKSSLILAAAIDGASTRYSIAILESYLDRHYGVPPAAFAAITIRNSLLSQLLTFPEKELQSALLAANDALRSKLEQIIGGFSQEHFMSLHPEVIQDDPRRFRLLLPASVATLVRIDITEQVLEYAHAGDTSLIEVRRDGTTVNHTPDQMRKFDEEVLRFAVDLRQKRNLLHVKDAVKQSEVVTKDRENGLRHNYVNPSGTVIIDEGSGALNGLPELAAFIVSGRFKYDPVLTSGFCLTTDGLRLPAPLYETAHEEQQRLERMGELLLEGGVNSVYEEMRGMIEVDPYYDLYPRIKNQDDATGVWIRKLNE